MEENLSDDEVAFIDAIAALAESGEDYARHLYELIREMIELRLLDEQIMNGPSAPRAGGI